MLERIDGLPESIFGLRAKGNVSRDDYDQVVLPYVVEARREGRRVRFLYHFGPEFKGFTPGAAWEDMRIGLRYVRLFERCAVVSDIPWVRRSSRAVGMLLPCPLRVFRDAELDQAIEWLGAPLETSVTHRIVADRAVLLVEPQGKLRSEDFDALTAAVDSWIETTGGALRGIVVHARKFPGWENLGSFFRHVRFVRDHHRKIRRIAVATDSAAGKIAPAVLGPFVKAEIKRFDADELDDAIAWASAEETAGVKEAR